MDIREIREEDREKVFGLMRVFYDSPALIHKSSDYVLMKNIDACISENPFIFGYVFWEEGEIVGYAMVSKSFTTEYGGLCVWVEDLFIEEQFRGRGFGSSFFRFLENEYKDAVRFKLEVEEENERAIEVYHKNGYEISKYFMMTKEIFKDE